MATPTYTPIASITLGSSASSVSFSSIPQTYRDLVLVVNGGLSDSGPSSVELYPNGDTSNGSMVWMLGTGSSTQSASLGRIFTAIAGSNSISIIQCMDYSATDKHKSFLIRDNNPGSDVRATAGRWASTAAMTSLEITENGGSIIDSGTTLALYGIEA